ncbi:hypothetical protein X798_04779 [Onchocerca flexuosa]|uniref:Ovule protein n=2 Tax=Onchocerca flexuosa TaxID=387005 RepID=A0A183H7X3_9BILA|nr:hypothetical protein X798_04779 [Onchocerca flexuosa]VDO37040.1 unnamed protein product [Onchocerca flexuosa]
MKYIEALDMITGCLKYDLSEHYDLEYIQHYSWFFEADTSLPLQYRSCCKLGASALCNVLSNFRVTAPHFGHFTLMSSPNGSATISMDTTHCNCRIMAENIV